MLGLDKMVNKPSNEMPPQLPATEVSKKSEQEPNRELEKNVLETLRNTDFAEPFNKLIKNFQSRELNRLASLVFIEDVEHLQQSVDALEQTIQHPEVGLIELESALLQILIATDKLLKRPRVNLERDSMESLQSIMTDLNSVGAITQELMDKFRLIDESPNQQDGHRIRKALSLINDRLMSKMKQLEPRLKALEILINS